MAAKSQVYCGVWNRGTYIIKFLVKESIKRAEIHRKLYAQFGNVCFRAQLCVLPLPRASIMYTTKTSKTKCAQRSNMAVNLWAILSVLTSNQLLSLEQTWYVLNRWFGKIAGLLHVRLQKYCVSMLEAWKRSFSFNIHQLDSARLVPRNLCLINTCA